MEYCLAKCSNDKWYRVQAVEIKYDGHITALFVDYGNVDIMKINCFRIMPLVLMFPCITTTVTCFDNADGELASLFFNECIYLFSSFIYITSISW